LSSAPATDCIDCTDELDHCHWAWVRHPDGHGECLALECRLGPEAHVVIVACVDVDDRCCA
jgi:hypothetical protein